MAQGVRARGLWRLAPGPSRRLSDRRVDRPARRHLGLRARSGLRGDAPHGARGMAASAAALSTHTDRIGKDTLMGGTTQQKNTTTAQNQSYGQTQQQQQQSQQQQQQSGATSSALAPWAGNAGLLNSIFSQL